MTNENSVCFCGLLFYLVKYLKYKFQYLCLKWCFYADTMKILLIYWWEFNLFAMQFDALNIDVRRQRWIFSQHLFRSVVHLWTQSCSSPVQCLVVLANFPSNSGALHSGTYPCCNQRRRQYNSLNTNENYESHLKFHLKYFSWARRTFDGAWEWMIFISKSIFSYQLGPL